MQDAYVGDIGDYGKYGLLRAVTASGLRLSVNWYRTVPCETEKKRGKGAEKLAANRRMGNTPLTWVSRNNTGTMIRNCLIVWPSWCSRNEPLGNPNKRHPHGAVL